MIIRPLPRRRFAALLLGAAVVPVLPGHNRAFALPAPNGKLILTVSGAIASTNRSHEAVFERALLETLGSAKIKTTNPWSDGADEFEGVGLATLMKAVGATGSLVTAYALNDFTTKIPVSDFSRFHPILALKRNGEYMPVRDKGPLFIVYPYDSDPELRQQLYYNRSAWQIARLKIE